MSFRKSESFLSITRESLAMAMNKFHFERKSCLPRPPEANPPQASDNPPEIINQMPSWASGPAHSRCQKCVEKIKTRRRNGELRYGWENNRDVIRNKLLMEALLPAARKLII
jgi:hypothetical protein